MFIHAIYVCILPFNEIVRTELCVVILSNKYLIMHQIYISHITTLVVIFANSKSHEI